MSKKRIILAGLICGILTSGMVAVDGEEKNEKFVGIDYKEPVEVKKKKEKFLAILEGLDLEGIVDKKDVKENIIKILFDQKKGIVDYAILILDILEKLGVSPETVANIALTSIQVEAVVADVLKKGVEDNMKGEQSDDTEEDKEEEGCKGCCEGQHKCDGSLKKEFDEQ